MSDIHLDISAGRERGAVFPLEETPLRIGLLGDWTARGSRNQGEGALADRRPLPLDRDTVEALLSRLAPELVLRLDPDTPPLTLRIRSLEDFHPDQLFARLPAFQALRALRQRLLDPTTFRATARVLTGEHLVPSSEPAPSGGDLLASIIDQATPVSTADALASSGGDLHSFIRQIIRPHLVPDPDPRQGTLVAQVDAAVSATMRAILHHPEFQALEALWRVADLLAYRLETSSQLRLEIIALSRADLAAALPPGGDPAESPLFRLLARHAQDCPWSLFATAFTFGAQPEEVEQLAQLAAIGQLLKAPWLASAHPRLLGTESLAITPDPRDWKPAPDPWWEAFRGTALARSVGLVLPRFLVRQPYGRGFESCERFAFEEFDGEPFHEQYLWGPPAFAVALLLGQGFADRGWGLAQGFDPELSGLPLVVRGKGVNAEAVACGETLLTERAAGRILDRGIMPLASLKAQDRVRLIRLQSVARPFSPLAGRWDPSV